MMRASSRMRITGPAFALVVMAALAVAAPSVVVDRKLPVLMRGIQVLDGDTPITVGTAVEVVDWNEDGKLDLLVGSGQGGLYLLLNRGTRENPRFEGAERLTAAREILRVGAG